MLSEPGVLDKNYEELDLALMAPQLINAVQSVKQELKKVTLEEEQESKEPVDQQPKGIDTDPKEMGENLEQSKQSN
jgi:hypothetical protein